MPEPISDAAITAALARHLTRAVQKQAVAAGNLANLDTPGFRTQEVKFSDALNEELAATGLVADHPLHIGAGAATGKSEMVDVAGLASRRDGNNVQLDREMLALTRAGGEFTQAQTVLAAKFRLVRYAINEGR
jgi:flagellar basal-body rod protein FlgB